MSTVRAAVFEEIGAPLSVEHVTPGEPGPRDVVVRVMASGVCHSDLSVVDGTIPLRKPAILGHEGAGLVESVGTQVTRVAPGDRVIASFIPACGACRACLAGRSNLCDATRAISRQRRGARADGSALQPMSGLGTFAEAMVCDEMSIVKVETDLPDEQLALIGCGVTTGVGAVLNTAQVEPGSSVAVVGCGGVGQSVVQGAGIAGAGRIIAIDPVAMKRETALALGATDAIDPADGSVVEQVHALTDGVGVDYAFEAIGNPAMIREAFELTRPGGACVVVGVPRADADLSFPAMGLIFGERRVLGSLYGSAQVRRDFPRLVRLAESGELQLDAMVSRRIHLHEVNDAFAALRAGEVIRSVIVDDPAP
jgi:S-(hydroxymethyl)glutathione dehydrogenase/alcohol dehydrogenase